LTRHLEAKEIVMPRRACIVAALFLVTAACSIAAQAKTQKAKSDTAAKVKKVDSAAIRAAARFYDTPEPLAFTLTLNVGLVRGDRKDDPPARDATVSYTDSAGQKVVIPVKVKTRGVWRLNHCEFPPLNLNFPASKIKDTPFAGVDKARLTSYCRDSDGYEQYILQELQLYRIYQVLTPYSHRARLLRITYVDSASGKTRATRYAFLIEDRDAMAARLNGNWMKIKGAGPSDLEASYSGLVGVFEYFIGNTDFGFGGLHNGELLANNMGDVIPVAYDFDYAGAVNARYATPDARFNLRSVRDRLFRGYCVPDVEFEKAFALFRDKKAAIYALYGDAVGKLMQPDVVRDTRKYYDEFYETINSPRSAKRDIIDACLGRK
jgi:hypothetical protein